MPANGSANAGGVGEGNHIQQRISVVRADMTVRMRMSAAATTMASETAAGIVAFRHANRMRTIPGAQS